VHFELKIALFVTVILTVVVLKRFLLWTF